MFYAGASASSSRSDQGLSNDDSDDDSDTISTTALLSTASTAGATKDSSNTPFHEFSRERRYAGDIADLRDPTEGAGGANYELREDVDCAALTYASCLGVSGCWWGHPPLTRSRLI